MEMLVIVGEMLRAAKTSAQKNHAHESLISSRLVVDDVSTTLRRGNNVEL